MTNMKKRIYGIIARCLTAIVRPRKKHWIFGCNMGKTYGEGPRCIMEYVVNHDPSIRCTWITMNRDVYNYCKEKHIRCYMNISLRGVWEIVKSDVVFTSHSAADIYFSYKRTGRTSLYLIHGQATKASRCAATVGYYINLYGISWLKPSLKKYLGGFFQDGAWAIESDFVSYTSDFVKEQTHYCFPEKVESKILGSPRIDIMFDKKKIYNEFFDQFKDKLIVTYMPTHRLFGKGELSPILFINSPEKQKWLKENNVVILIKQHPNMIPLINEEQNTGTIIDITKYEFDSMIIAANSDVLISDYSSIWLEYIILQRPLAHFIYDDFAIKDQGIFEEMYQYPGINMYYNEEDLFEFVKKCKSDYEKMRPRKETVSLFHKYIDGNSSKRYYDELIKIYR